MIARTADGRAFRILAILDEYTRECLAIPVTRHITSQDVIEMFICVRIQRNSGAYPVG